MTTEVSSQSLYGALLNERLNVSSQTLYAVLLEDDTPPSSSGRRRQAMLGSF